MKLLAAIDLTELSRTVPVVCAYPFILGCVLFGCSFIGFLKSTRGIKVRIRYFGLGLAFVSLLSAIATEILIGLLSGMAAG